MGHILIRSVLDYNPITHFPVLFFKPLLSSLFRYCESFINAINEGGDAANGDDGVTDAWELQVL